MKIFFKPSHLKTESQPVYHRLGLSVVIVARGGTSQYSQEKIAYMSLICRIFSSVATRGGRPRFRRGDPPTFIEDTPGAPAARRGFSYGPFDIQKNPLYISTSSWGQDISSWHFLSIGQGKVVEVPIRSSSFFPDFTALTPMSGV